MTAVARSRIYIEELYLFGDEWGCGMLEYDLC